MRGRLGSAVAFLLCLVVPPELVVRAFDLDYKVLAPLLYYQGAEVEAHAPVDDERLYGLRPGFSGELNGRRVTVNSLGFRGPERAALKKPGTLRVLCYGSSNTYGAAVPDDQTWPARLEAELSRRLRRPVEVWNGGVCAYSLQQITAAARIGASRYDPDLVLIQPLHLGRRPFLVGCDWKPAFERDPSLWLENLKRLPFSGERANLALLRWRTLRFFLIAFNELVPDPSETRGYAAAADVASLSRFERATRAPWALVVPPAAQLPATLLATERRRSLRLAERLPKGAGLDYRLVHPPAYVLDWYGRAIADFLAEDRYRLLSSNGKP